VIDREYEKRLRYAARREDQSILMVVHHPRPRCPFCGGHKLHPYRSIACAQDGTHVVWSQCKDEQCASRFKLILE